MRQKKKFSTETESPENQSRLAKKKFTTKDLNSFSPLNKSQSSFFEAFYSDIPVIIQDGPAGTGKSVLSIYCALTEIFSNDSPYEKLIVIRSAVETRSQGFLPGTKEEKDEVFERPYQDIVNNITKYNETYKYLKLDKNKYEFMTTAHLRGLTFDNCIIIVDEAQNADIAELSTIFTRLGTNSRIIVNGDSAQDDLFRKREKSGFERFKTIIDQMPIDLNARVTYGFDDIVRSRLVKEYIIAESKVY